MMSDKTIDLSKVKNFWDAQAKKAKFLDLERISNLEENDELHHQKIDLEQKKIMNIIKLDKNSLVLDLGAGVGTWSRLFSKQAKKVVSVEYSKDISELAVAKITFEGIKNIDFVTMPAQNYLSEEKFDVIFISGLLIYLNDKECETLIKNCAGQLRQGGQLILRDGTSINDKDYLINDEFSKGLGLNYSAYYRTSKKYISMFKLFGFILLDNQNMFEDGSPLNKWENTRLSIYEFSI